MIPADCAQILDVPLMRQIVRVESSGNPYAIGVVGGRLVRQPSNLAEAVATVLDLERKGYNYSIGAGQINRQHFRRLGWERDIRAGFDVCSNLRASLYQVVIPCYERAVEAGYPRFAPAGVYGALNATSSCYYSGRLATPVAADYVRKVLGPHAAVVSLGVNKAKTAHSLLQE